MIHKLNGREWTVRGLTRAERKALNAQGINLIALADENAEDALDAVLMVLWPDAGAREALAELTLSDALLLFKEIVKETYTRQEADALPVLSRPLRGLKLREARELRKGGIRIGAINQKQLDAACDAVLAIIFPDAADQAKLDALPHASSMGLFAEIGERTMGKGSAVKNS